MNDIIQRIVEKTGISDEQASSVMQIIVGLVKERLPGPVAAQVESVLTGASGSSDVVGGIGGALGGLFGKS